MLTIGLNVVYVLLLAALTPWLVYRRVAQRKTLAGLAEKFWGRVARKNPERPCVWFHAVSVGEVLQLQHLLAEFSRRHPDVEVLLTTTTATGYEVAREKFPQHTLAYWPLDFSWAVARALRSVRPQLVVLVELELWPNFLLAAQREKVPVMLINGRIGAKSHRGYARLRWFWRRPLSAVTHAAVQTDEYARRLVDLGLSAERVSVTGNIKYDRVQSDRMNPHTAELRTAFGLSADDLVFVAGSTQEPEEQYALDAWQTLRQEIPALRLLLVPRHKERFSSVARLVTERGLPLLRRSALSAPGKASPSGLPPVLLLDTLGELAAAWGLADIAFVGGSLTQRGGQNMLEPAGYGAAILFGPNTWNFRAIVEALLARNAACVVRDADELRETVRRLALDAHERQRLGAAARAFVLAQQGATVRTLELLDAHWPASRSLPAAA
jgi:3-deoxy-D-manno-octulosonic-acid transferase